jgi:hypothetical protein
MAEIPQGMPWGIFFVPSDEVISPTKARARKIFFQSGINGG